MGDFLANGVEWLIERNTDDAGQSVTIIVDGQQPVVVDALVTEEKRERRQDSHGVQVVNTRQVTVTSTPGINDFSGLIQAKLSAVVEVSDRRYAVESVQNHRGAIVLDLLRESTLEMSRPNYRGRGL